MDEKNSQEPSTTQACCVCGEKTDQRCSACEEAGFDLFFCSREHQKLVWKNAHSEVCGPKSTPFLPPSLSPDELTATMKLLHKPFPTEVESKAAHRVSSRVTIGSFLSTKTKMPITRLKKDFPKIMQSPRLSSQVRYDIITFLRLFLWTEACREQVRREQLYTVPLFQHVQHLLCAAHASSPPPGNEDVETSSSYSSFQHLAVVFFALARHTTAPQAPLPSETLDQFCSHACQRLLQHFANQATFLSPEEATQAMGSLAVCMLPALTNGISFEYQHGLQRVKGIKVGSDPRFPELTEKSEKPVKQQQASGSKEDES